MQINCEILPHVCTIISADHMSCSHKTLYWMSRTVVEVLVLGSSALYKQKMQSAVPPSVFHEITFSNHHCNLQTRSKNKPTKDLYS